MKILTKQHGVLLKPVIKSVLHAFFGQIQSGYGSGTASCIFAFTEQTIPATQDGYPNQLTNHSPVNLGHLVLRLLNLRTS